MKMETSIIGFYIISSQTFGSSSQLTWQTLSKTQTNFVDLEVSLGMCRVLAEIMLGKLGTNPNHKSPGGGKNKSESIILFKS